jgi:hypothetical protein
VRALGVRVQAARIVVGLVQQVGQGRLQLRERPDGVIAVVPPPRLVWGITWCSMTAPPPSAGADRIGVPAGDQAAEPVRGLHEAGGFDAEAEHCIHGDRLRVRQGAQ